MGDRGGGGGVKGGRFNQITILTLRIRKDRPGLSKQSQTQLRRHRVYTVCHSSSNFTHIQR